MSSTQDKASQNILSKLLEREWDEIDEWREEPIYERNGDILAIIEERHIYFDDIDKKLENFLEEEFDEVVYISKHSSEAGMDSLTVHPIGNYGEAKYGGEEGKLVSSSPQSMTEALLEMRKIAKREGVYQKYDVSFEATHHGPYLETPTYYIEIGSDIDSWTDDRAGKVITETVLEVKEGAKKEDPVAICIGGGHYAPRFSDLVKSRKVAVGHMVPGWAMKYLTSESFEEAVEKTPGVEYVYFDRSSTSGKERKKIKNWAESFDLEIVRSDDLEKREK